MASLKNSSVLRGIKAVLGCPCLEPRRRGLGSGLWADWFAGERDTRGELFTVSRDWLTLGRQLLRASKAPR